MYNVQAKGLTSALYATGKLLLKEGVSSSVRANTAGNGTLAFSEPICVEIENPRLRNIFLAERKWNNTLPHAESLWIALGWNNLDDLPGRYVKNLYNFSDDGETWRAGYGPRIRHFTASYDQYNIGAESENYGVDQLRYVVESFKRDPNTRQADISIHDPAKDCFVDGELIKTKDTPCTRSLHFQKNPKTGALDLVVRMRSNDLLWGFSAVNVFNFTMMQEYVAWMTGLPVGKYFHIADNLHIYEDYIGKLKRILSYEESYINETEAKLESLLVTGAIKTRSVDVFDSYIALIRKVEDNLYKAKSGDDEEYLNAASAAMHTLIKCPDFFSDWAVVLAQENIRKNKLGKIVRKGLYSYRSDYMKYITEEFK